MSAPTLTAPDNEMLALIRQIHAAVTGGVPPLTQRAGPDSLYPDPTITPGWTNPDVTQESIATTIAVPGWTATIRPPESEMAAMKDAYCAAHNIADPTQGEWDHFISLELGGHPRDHRNLWWQQYEDAAHPIGARAKDRVESALKVMIVRGEITLAEAQRQITTDWFAVFLHLHKHGRLPAVVKHDPTV